LEFTSRFKGKKKRMVLHNTASYLTSADPLLMVFCLVACELMHAVSHGAVTIMNTSINPDGVCQCGNCVKTTCLSNGLGWTQQYSFWLLISRKVFT